jgi:hypothetical protein
MPVASISGTISVKGHLYATGYLHIKYDMQVVDGKLHTPYDIVIFPTDNKGTVSFTLPQGIRARIEVWSEMNGKLVTAKVVLIPKMDNVALENLLK